jgi:hypothetical protein
LSLPFLNNGRNKLCHYQEYQSISRNPYTPATRDHALLASGGTQPSL